MQQLQFYIVDAFVDPDKPFSGNPAAVVLLDNDVNNHKYSECIWKGQQ